MVDGDSALSGVVVARFQSFAKRMPAYYASFVAMMLALVYVFYPLAPFWMSSAVPLAASALGIWRGIYWWRHREVKVTDAEAQKQLKRSTINLVCTALIIVALDIRLFAYANVHARYFVLIQLVVSVMCGFYCLMHLQTAALAICAAVMVPFFGLAVSMHQSSLTAAACTATLTVGVMILAMLGYQKDFISLVKAKAEMVKLSEENLQLASLDMLTGLPNRRRFFQVLEGLVSIDASAQAYAVGLIDLDGFKPVNDTHGHVVGDLVLVEIAKRLQQAVPSAVQHLCRLGGDEFAFLTIGLGEESLLQLGAEIIAAVRRPVHLQGRIISVGCSVGFATWVDLPEITGPVLFERADYAMYHAKRNGRSCAVLFSEEHETRIREHGKIEQSLRSADLEEEFYPVFQPIVDLHSRSTLGFECLARWKSPLLGEISPGAFIPIAEHSGLISDLTRVLLRKGLQEAANWPENIHIAFNVSPHDLASHAKTCSLIAVIEESGIHPGRVAIELTESALLHNFSEVSQHLGMLRDLGVTISLDDFGTGHSSLSYVHALPLDKIKVDRSFVQDLDSDEASRNIVRSVITLCRDLGLASVVEGVETASQLDILQQMGGDLIQGYFFAKPMPSHAIAKYLQSEHPSYAQPVASLQGSGTSLAFA